MRQKEKKAVVLTRAQYKHLGDSGGSLVIFALTNASGVGLKGSIEDGLWESSAGNKPWCSFKALNCIKKL